MSCLNFKTFVLKYRYSNNFKTIFLTVKLKCVKSIGSKTAVKGTGMFQGGWCPIIYGVINLAVTELSIDPSLWARPIRGTNWFLSSSTIKSLIGIICVETKKKLILSFLGWITVCIISTHHSKMQKDGLAKCIQNFAFKWC